MLLSALIAFGHFVAFFALTSALTLELALLKPSPDIETANRIRRADRAYGLMAMLVLVFGFLRVFYFEKGSDYYFDNTFFWIKIALFAAVGIMSIKPTVTFLHWGAAIEKGVSPDFSDSEAASVRKLLHYQLIGIAGIIFCASMMAHGFGV